MFLERLQAPDIHSICDATHGKTDGAICKNLSNAMRARIGLLIFVFSANP